MSTTPHPVDLTPQFPVLDTLRAVGALAVLTTHTAFQTGSYLTGGTWGALLARLDVGVAVFFVLSGFLLSRPYLARRRRGLPPPGLARYYRKRALRILPVSMLTAAIALLVMGSNAEIRRDPGQWVSSLLLLDPYFYDTLPHGLTHMWSLTVEVSFYLVLPLLMLLGSRGIGWLIGLCAAMAALSLVWVGVIEDHLVPVVVGAPWLWLPAYLTWFAAGIGLAALQVSHQAGTLHPAAAAARRLFAQPGVCWTLAVGLLLICATPLAGPTMLDPATTAQGVFKHVAYAGIGLLIVASGVFADDGRYRRLLSARPLRRIGHISYGVFCIHVVLIALAFHLLGLEPFTGHHLPVWALTLAMSLVAAELLYRLVERPAMNLGNRSGRWRSGPARRASGTRQAPTAR